MIECVYFDSHCHFDFPEFDAERAQLWQLCQQQHITRLVIPSTTPDRWVATYEMTQLLPGVFMAVGVHPWWINGLNDGVLSDEMLAKLASYLKRDACVAIGECGLDKVIDTPLAKQQTIFEQHLQLACDTVSPLIIHVRKTHNQTLRLLKRYRPPVGGVIHGFSGSLEQAQQYWALGFYLGVGGSITYSRARKTRHAMQSMPLEALLLETDAPDMPLYGYQGQSNSPLKVIDVAKALAYLRGEVVTHIAQQTTDNANRLFQL